MPVPIAVLIGPDKDYLDKEGLAEFLKVTPKELRALIRDRWLPNPKARKGKPRALYTREEAAICKWIVDNMERFEQQMPGKTDTKLDQ